MIIIQVGVAEIGVIVDMVKEVIDISESDIEKPPAIGGNVDFILGLGKVADKVYLLLDIQKIVSNNDVANFKEDENEFKG